jgi:hypothetical protein
MRFITSKVINWGMTGVMGGMLIAEPMLHLEDKFFKNTPSLEAVISVIPSIPHTDPKPPIDTTEMIHQNTVVDSTALSSGFSIKVL